MFSTLLATTLVIFLVTSLPALATKRFVPSLTLRNFGFAGVMGLLLSNGEGHYSQILLASGLLAGLLMSLVSWRNGLKCLYLEAALLFFLLLYMIAFKGDPGGLFRGHGLERSFMFLEGILSKNGTPLQSYHFGLFTLGTFIGMLAAIPARLRLHKWLAKQKARRTLERLREIPEAQLISSEGIALKGMFKRNQRKLAARIDRVTMR